MSKTYDALLKSQRENRDHKQVGPPAEPERDAPEPKKEAKEEAVRLGPTHGIEPRAPTPRPTVHLERVINRVTIGGLLAKPDSVLEEQFRRIKSAITTHKLANSLQSALVASCLPAEGKTTVALNLAATLARGLDDSAILIDADLRKRKLTSILGLRDACGLSDILEGKGTIEESLVKTEIEGLLILPAGVSLGNPAELIASSRMRNLVKMLREQYKDSFVIIDSTPMASTSEVYSLSQMVDGVLVVVMADSIRRDLVMRELKTINREKILGVILNCAEFDTSDYYQKYYRH